MRGRIWREIPPLPVGGISLPANFLNEYRLLSGRCVVGELAEVGADEIGVIVAVEGNNFNKYHYQYEETDTYS